MYNGYRVKVGDTIIPNNLIAKGSYNFAKVPRPIRSWEDGNGISHEDYFQKERVSINFSIIERDLTEQEEIKEIFSNEHIITVQYWDDYICEYVTGTFKKRTSALAHRSSYGGSIQYSATKVVLEEY